MILKKRKWFQSIPLWLPIRITPARIGIDTTTYIRITMK
jgi:hypothetical protein